MQVIYDGECPFCSAFVKMSRLKSATNQVELINARDDDVIIKKMWELGYDLNEGMVVIHNDNIFFGADAINIIALMTTKSGFFNRIIAILFKSKNLSNILYPILVFGRNVTLKILGRKKISQY
jgi:predicted DCC family thiol-disulfide oxidoreductase YuxK